jgi:hypothetical protein
MKVEGLLQCTELTAVEPFEPGSHLHILFL